MDEEKLIDFTVLLYRTRECMGFLECHTRIQIQIKLLYLPQIYRTIQWRGILQSSMDE
jgi:hypothetical protein